MYAIHTYIYIYMHSVCARGICKIYKVLKIIILSYVYTLCNVEYTIYLCVCVRVCVGVCIRIGVRVCARARTGLRM